MERAGERRVLRIAAAGACDGATTIYLPGCNLRCVHCWAGQDREHPEIAEWLTYREIARRIRLYRNENRTGELTRNVRLSGGEPVLSERFFDLLEALFGVANVVFVETNAVLLGFYPDWCRRLSNYGQRVFLKVSIKAGTPQSYEKVTGVDASAWQATWNAIRALAEARIGFDLNALTLSPELFPERERGALMEHLERIGPGLVDRLQHEAITEYPETVRRMTGWCR